MTEAPNSVVKHILAGAGAGWMTAFVTCPLDVVKTRLQADRAHQMKGRTFHSLSTLWHNEGLRGMYRGLGPTLIGYLPAFSIYFPTYHLCKVTLVRWRCTEMSSDSLAHMLSAMVAGAAGNLCTNPLWVVRTRLMTQHALHESSLYAGTLDAFRNIYKGEGIRGFYKGAIVSMMGVVHVAVQFPLYERLKLIQVADEADLTAKNILLASTVAKVVASTATYPHEVVRTRLQVQRNRIPQYNRVIDAISNIWREEGYRGFYRGLSTNIIRVIPASAVTFVTYESLLKHLS